MNKLLLVAVSLSLPVSAFASAAITLENALSLPSKSFKFVHAASFNDEDNLIRLLDDRDANVRAAAARSLKAYAQSSYNVENALLERANASNEVEAVRREAIKSLAWAAQHWNTRDALVRLAESGRETNTLRAIAYKSLYVIGNDDSVRTSLKRALSNSNEGFTVRSAAAWALFGSAPADYDTREQLLRVAKNSSEPWQLRVEALKSLYSALGDWNTRDAVLRLAQDSSETLTMRETAMLSLHAINTDWNVKDYLQRESSDERNSQLRTAAIRALGGPDLALARYFHLSMYLGRYIDPLEDQ